MLCTSVRDILEEKHDVQVQGSTVPGRLVRWGRGWGGAPDTMAGVAALSASLIMLMVTGDGVWRPEAVRSCVPRGEGKEGVAQVGGVGVENMGK